MNNIILTFAILGNICNFAYNVPFVYVVWKHWNANNISQKFLILRIIGSLIWIGYSILITDLFVGLSYSVTFLSSSFIFFVKITQKKSSPISNSVTNTVTNSVTNTVTNTVYKESVV